MIRKPLKTKKSLAKVSQKVALETLTLISSAFGLSAALAWNEAIKEYVNVFIKPYFAHGSGVVSLFIYAVSITTIAVIATYQLNKLSRKVAKQS